MNEQLRESIELIRHHATGLNEVTDDAQAIVARVEKFLNECSIGLAADVEFDEVDAGPKTSRCRCLSYARVDGKYRIAVTTHLFLDHGEPQLNRYWSDPDNPPKSWGSCRRETKLASFKVLPELLTTIAEQAGNTPQTVNETNETVAKLKKLLDDVNCK